MGPFNFTLFCGNVVDRRARTSITVPSDLTLKHTFSQSETLATAYNTRIG